MTGSHRSEIADLRLCRLEQAVGDVVVSPIESIASPKPLIGITSSRLGHDTQLHRNACRFLTRSILQCRQRGGTLLVASGSAIELWATRAAELFAVPMLVLSVDDRDRSFLSIKSRSGNKLSRDAVLIALADRVDAVYVRRGGKIEKCFNARLSVQCDASTRVAVTLTQRCAAANLIAKGAIGWYVAPEVGNERRDNNFRQSVPGSASDDSWTKTDGCWLVHCTRGRHGAWPGETDRQYRDAVLLGATDSMQRGPLETLARIVSSGRLIAGSVGTRKSHPVVCFSEAPLHELLQRRCFRPHLGRWDYEPYGIAIRTKTAKEIGIRPVIYGKADDRKRLSPGQLYRFHPVGKTYDWRAEREWRSPANIELTDLNAGDVNVFVNEPADLEMIPSHCPWTVTVLNHAKKIWSSE